MRLEQGFGGGGPDLRNRGARLGLDSVKLPPPLGSQLRNDRSKRVGQDLFGQLIIAPHGVTAQLMPVTAAIPSARKISNAKLRIALMPLERQIETLRRAQRQGASAFALCPAPSLPPSAALAAAFSSASYPYRP
jgi:hypothetical protein